MASQACRAAAGQRGEPLRRGRDRRRVRRPRALPVAGQCPRRGGQYLLGLRGERDPGVLHQGGFDGDLGRVTEGTAGGNDRVHRLELDLVDELGLVRPERAGQAERVERHGEHRRLTAEHD